MAARRDVPQHVHQRPWTSGGNPNRLDAEAMKGGAPTSWDLEVRRLRAKGIEEEVLLQSPLLLCSNICVWFAIQWGEGKGEERGRVLDAGCGGVISKSGSCGFRFGCGES
uniref:Uncharacterized protein n=1 Tax=Arundo donax TaxID=35708 RepID=A0A0A9AGS8_ARUDO